MTGKVAFQSNFKFYVRDTLKILTYVQLTSILHYRIHDFLGTELSVRKTF